VRGNHDKVASGLDNAEDFNPMAKAAARWTRESLTPQNLDYLRDLPAGPCRRWTQSRFATARRSTRIFTSSPTSTPRASIAVSRAAICLFRPHARRAHREMDSQRRLEIEAPQGHPEFAVAIDPGSKYMINPGRSASPVTVIHAPLTRLPTSIAWS
jgi:hypothetical protein